MYNLSLATWVVLLLPRVMGVWPVLLMMALLVASRLPLKTAMSMLSPEKMLRRSPRRPRMCTLLLMMALLVASRLPLKTAMSMFPPEKMLRRSPRRPAGIAPAIHSVRAIYTYRPLLAVSVVLLVTPPTISRSKLLATLDRSRESGTRCTLTQVAVCKLST